MPLHVPAVPEVIVPITVHTFDIDGSFDDDESIIGGAVTIDGIVLLVKQEDTQGDDENGYVGLDIDGVNLHTHGWLYGNGHIIGLGASKAAGASESLGLVGYIHDDNLDLPFTSFNLVNREGATKYFHRTIKVVVLNRS